MTPRIRHLLAALSLVGLGLGAHSLRRALIRSFFVDGPGGPPPALTLPGDPALARAPGVRAAPRLRVLLLDGLGGAEAERLPVLNGLCAAGIDLLVDAGFPTVSLPIQRVLFTGLTQRQSGVQYRTARIDPPLRESLPGLVPGSAAVAEAHAEIVRSFAFARTEPPLRMPPPDGARWRDEGFAAAARALSGSPAPFVFFHVLRIDEAGHRQGAGSAAYRQAAREADALLGALLADDRRAHPDSAWFVLSDHGHGSSGGHGDAEEAVRLVRACIAGAAPAAALPQGRRLHLVDLSRALFDAAGVPPLPGAAGRPLPFALAHPDPDATLPRPSPLLWGSTILIMVGALGAGLAALPRVWAAPFWLPVAYGAVLVALGTPTLSNRAVYPPLGRDMMLAAAPGLLLLLLTLVLSRGRAPLSRVLLAQLALPLCAALAALNLCGGLGRLLGLTAEPPLRPLWTGHASFLLALSVSGCLVAALPALAAAVRGPSDPSGGAGSAGRAA